MKRTIHVIAWITGLVVVTSCFRSDYYTVSIDVPELSDAFAVRVVTNAVLNEVVGQYDGVFQSCEVDLAKGLLIYHEKEVPRAPEYWRLIENRISEVGFTARVLQVESSLSETMKPRYRAIISVSDMKTNRDANTIVDAIAFARIGENDPRVTAHSSARQVIATYDGRKLATMNIVYAIASVGYRANDVPALLGRPDAIPRGWTPTRL